MPVECPECQRMIGPASAPKVGDVAVCPCCSTALVFVEGLILEKATREQCVAAGLYRDPEA